jgi:chromate transporter
MNNLNKKTPQMMWEIFSVYFKSMLFAFTGGSVTLPILQQQLDDRYHLIDKDKVLEYFAVGQAMPGVVSLNAGLMIGSDICGWAGALAAALGTVLPAFFGMLLVTLTYSYLNGLDWIKGAIEGVRAASVAIIMTNAINIAKRGKSKWEFILMVFSFIAVLFLNWGILTVILLNGFIGISRVVYKNHRRVN